MIGYVAKDEFHGRGLIKSIELKRLFSTTYLMK